MNTLLPNINIQNLIVFFTVVEQNGFSKASSYLHMTQSAISKSIARLESELDLKLFIRTTKEFALTEVGRFLYDNWKADLTNMQHTYLMAQDMYSSESKELHIAISNTTLPNKYLWPVVEKFREKYNDVEINIDSDYLTVLPEKLKERLYDVIFIPDFEHYSLDDKTMEWKWAAKNNVQIIVSLENPLSSKAMLILDDLKNETFSIMEESTSANYLRDLNDFFEKTSLVPKTVRTYKNPYSIKTAYKGTQGLIFTDDFFDFGDNKYFKKIPLEGYYNGVICAWNKKMRTSYIKKFLDLLPLFVAKK